MDLIDILFSKALLKSSGGEEINNDVATKEFVNAAIDAIKNGVSEEHDTLKEIEDTLTTKLTNSPTKWPTWTVEEQAIAKEKIGFTDNISNVVRYDTVQALSDEQRAQARENISAASTEDFTQFKSELVTNKNSVTENTRFAIGIAEESLEVPSMEEFNGLKNEFKNSVLYTPQTLTNDQQAQVRANIGAADVVAVTQLKDDLSVLVKYKDDHPQYNFEQGTIRFNDGYIVKGNTKGIYTPNTIYFAKSTRLAYPKGYNVLLYRYTETDDYIGAGEQIAESGYYRICIYHADVTDIDVSEAENVSVDEKPRITDLENHLSAFEDETKKACLKHDGYVIASNNIVDIEKCMASGTGSVNANTGIISTEGGHLYIYGMYDLEVGTDYVISKCSSYLYMYFYNDDGSYTGPGTIFTVNGAEAYKTFNAAYPKCIIASAKDAIEQQIQLEKGTAPSNYVPQFVSLAKSIKITDKTLFGKMVLIIGDSISTGDSSLKLYGDEKYGGYNKWVDALIEEGFFNKYQTRNDSIHATGYVAKVSTFGDCDYVSRLKNVTDKSTYDYVIVTGCYNDWGQDVPLDDFKAAVESFYEYLVNNFTQAKIIVTNSLKSFRFEYANTNGNYQREYNDYVKEVAYKYSLPFYDLFNQSGFYPNVQAFREMWTYYSVADGETEGVYDGVHPNEKWCREYMAPLFKHFIEQYI